MSTQIGNLCHNDIFRLDGREFKVGHCIENTNGYVACVDIKTHKVTRFHLTVDVEEIKYD